MLSWIHISAPQQKVFMELLKLASQKSIFKLSIRFSKPKQKVFKHLSILLFPSIPYSPCPPGSFKVIASWNRNSSDLQLRYQQKELRKFIHEWYKWFTQICVYIYSYIIYNISLYMIYICGYVIHVSNRCLYKYLHIWSYIRLACTCLHGI